MRATRTGAVLAMVLAIAACGGDDDDAVSEPVSEPAEAPADGSDGGDEDADADGGGAGGEGDIIDAILRNVFGLSGDILDDRERACMNDELAPVFPDGVPDDITIDDPSLDALDAAAEACDAEIGR